MDLTTIAAAQASVKAVLQLAKGATQAAVDNQLKERLIGIQGAILDAQEKLADAQEERLNLLQQVAELRERLRRHEATQAALDAYELQAVEDGMFLYRFKQEEFGGVHHFACPTCHNSGKVTVLQSKKTGAQQTMYFCQTCKFDLFVGPNDPPRPLRRSNPY